MLDLHAGFARGPVIVLWLVLMVCAADIGAYFAGRAFGTAEIGAAGESGQDLGGRGGRILMVALVAGGGARYFGLPPLDGVVFGCGVGIFSVIGDLTESMFKRAAALKDSGTLLAGTWGSVGSHRQCDGGGASCTRWACSVPA